MKADLWAEAAAHLYQALLRVGQAQPLPVNVAAGDDTDVGIWVGVGYNFTGF
jgi:hypothetical protein